MAACACGAPIRFGRTADGEVVRLDAVGSYGGAGRYRVVDETSSPLLIEPVTERADVAAYADHDRTCPRS